MLVRPASEYLKDGGDASRVTMNFFPTATPTTRDDNVVMPKQMIIFYAGRVIVLENVSSDKANEVMRIATNLGSSVCNTGSSLNMFLPHTFVRDLSQTRTRSLTRFFDKRKERINARAPYKPVAPKSWLCLAAAAANQTPTAGTK